MVSGFSKKYTVLSYFWFTYLKLEHPNFVREAYVKGYKKHIEWNDTASIIIQIKDIGEVEKGDARMEEALGFPHANLKSLWDAYQSCCAKPISRAIQEKYEKSLELYKKLKKCDEEDAEGNEENDKKWLEYIKEIEDPEAVLANLKFRITMTKRSLKSI
uniref:Uncharacterized protein n=1 Tax=Panagrolaimus sp. ES5 TaxID=591445 RepID=A0AC34FJ23_9BILA